MHEQTFAQRKTGHRLVPELESGTASALRYASLADPIDAALMKRSRAPALLGNRGPEEPTKASFYWAYFAEFKGA